MLEHDRRIAAILAADVVGYSRLMGVDEESTLAGLKLRRSIFDQLVAEYGGHEFGSVGDSLMAEFPSAVNAVRCAQAIQQAVGKENEPLPADRRMALRIGINLGDVINENGTLFGGGVNLAARLQSLAAPGGILISGAVHEQVKKKLPVRFTFTGLHHVKNIVDPVATYEVLLPDERYALLKGCVRYARRPRVATIGMLALLTAGMLWWVWRSDVTVTQLQSMLQPASPPSIAVLPFVNISSDPDNEYFSDGISEQLLDRLAQNSALRVIGHTSSFAFKGKALDLAAIGAQLHVDNLIEGSVRKVGARVRIVARVVSVKDGFQLWSGSFDRDLRDMFAVQEEIANHVAEALQIAVMSGSARRSALAPTQSPEAYELYLRGRYLWRQRARATLPDAVALLERAVSIDSTYGAAYAALASAYVVLPPYLQVDPTEANRRAVAAAERALQIDPSLAEARAVLAGLDGRRGEWGRSLAQFERALSDNPGDSTVHQWYGETLLEVGRIEDGWREVQKARDLDPMSVAQMAFAVAAYVAGREEEAAHAIDVANRLGYLAWPSFASCFRRGDIARGLDLLRGEPELHDLYSAVLTNRRSGRDADNVQFVQRWFATHGYSNQSLPVVIELRAAVPALKAIENAFARDNTALIQLWRAEARFIRQHPSFAPFAERTGLLRYWQQGHWPDICHATERTFVCQ